MSRYFNGSTDCISYANVVDLEGSDLTISAWVYLDVDNANMIFFHAADPLDTEGVPMGCWGGSQAGELFLSRSGDGSDYLWHERYGSGSFSTATWHHALVVDDGTPYDYAGMECYIDGAVPGSETDSGTASTEDAHTGTWNIGNYSTADSFAMDGGIAEVAVWNRILSAGEIAALAKGFSPLFFPRGLLFYVPLIGRKDVDRVAGKTPTYDGTQIEDHPRIIYPS